jgi:uncharacterized protein
VRYRKLSTWLRERYGEKVYKFVLRGEFTCPNRDGTVGRGGCTFCSLAALEPAGYDPADDIARQVAWGMSYVRRRHGARKFIAYFQDYSATYADPEVLRRTYEPAIAPPEVVQLAIGTRPDCLPEPVLDLLAELAQRTDVTLDLGLQVASDDVLKSLNRCHTVEDYARAVRACHDRGLPVCAHVILGLPGAGLDHERRTADLLADLGVWSVKVHALHVIRGTVLGKRYEAGEFQVISQAEYNDRAVDFLERLPAETVSARLTGAAPRELTLAPEWTINKLAAEQAVLARLEARQTWQGRLRGASALPDFAPG